jgi:hypothetical protein
MVWDWVTGMPNWQNPAELRLLREVTFYYMLCNSDGQGMNVAELLKSLRPHFPEDIRQELDTSLESGKKPAGYDALDRFLHFEHLHPRPGRNTLHDALFRHVVGWMFEHQADRKVRKSKFLVEIKDRAPDWFPALGQTPEVADVRPAGDFDYELLPLFEEFFKIDASAASRAAALQLTGLEKCRGNEPTTTERQGFETYRYSVLPGRVVKTFTLFTPPSGGWPFCSFENVYKSEQGRNVKHSSGIALKLEHGIYCIGRLHDANDKTTPGLKIIALPSQVWTGSILHGFIVTRDEDARLLVARTALQRSDAKTLEEGEPTVIPFENVSSTVDEDVLKRIRNTIGFEVGRLIYSNETQRHIDAKHMVELVAQLCHSRFTVSDRPFNPASHSFYPFNQALVPYSGGEDYVPWSTALPPSKNS